jgi:maleylacetate reductase
VALQFDHTTLGQRLLFGRGEAAANTARAVEAIGAARVLLIADGFAAAVADEIAGRVHVAARIDDVIQHVPVERAREAVELARTRDADAVVSVGGGSATGLAKAVALDTGLAIVAVPTTFAGSEATNVWGVTEANRKTTGVDDVVLPRVIVYDVALSAGLSVQQAAASGLNALAHAVDSFWAPRADPINRAMGSEALRALVPGLRALVAAPDDDDAREEVLYGAYLAAVSFASAGSGMHHKVCHVLGGAYDLPHAQTHAVVLPYVTQFNTPAAPDAASRVRAALGGVPAAGGLWELRAQLGAPASLREIGLDESDIPDAAGLVLAAIPPSNPRPVTRSDVERLLRAAWAGDPVHDEDQEGTRA